MVKKQLVDRAEPTKASRLDRYPAAAATRRPNGGHGISILLAFVLALVARDVIFDLKLLSYFGKAVDCALVVCLCIALASAAWLTAEGRWRSFYEKLRGRTVLWSSSLLGFLAAAIFGTTFSMIELLGSGIFNLIDWSFGPILTAAIGVAFWAERNIRPSILVVVTVMNLLGLGGLFVSGALSGPEDGDASR